MYEKRKIESDIVPSAIDTTTLMAYVGAGRATAVKIGDLAHARIKIGKRVLWNTERIKSYLDSITE